MLQAVVTCELNGTRFYLTEDGLATDIPDRAALFHDLTAAALKAVQERRDPAWGHQKWVPAYRFADGSIVSPTHPEAIEFWERARNERGARDPEGAVAAHEAEEAEAVRYLRGLGRTRRR